ncbi:MAG: hypothetical protein WBM50_18435 [Acidimicrobiales bacterium]
MTRPSRSQPARSLAGVALVSVAVMGGLIALALASGISIEAAVSDPHELTRLRFLGIVSNVGVLTWGAAMTICLFTAWIVEPGWSDVGPRSFFIASAGITLVLLIDDLLLVHELADDVVVRFVDFERTRRQKDILEAAVFASYGALFGLYALVYRQTILRANGRYLLVGALAMFAISVVIDFGLVDALGIDIPDYRDSIDLRSLLEEGAKLVGIAYYSAFYFSLADQRIGFRAARLRMERGPQIG